ncbi:hypothetical protein FWF48_00430 [Candidatus Saccharibacteria bacterium]|nr:hypothetical protein [Candidatus Saccharibacteria bacterium]
MPENKDPKTQILQQIQDAENILVTVNDNPSVDELTSALGLTLLVNKLGKRAVAVVSGSIPDALSFLQPEKTFENSVDSLRDFIIALNKEKADHLRYKIEGDFVKVFITPYHTTISEKDLEFSQGEFNIDLVIALNVETQDKLDAALKVHGQILHNAVVSTINTNGTKSSLGTINWIDNDASSLSEMIVGLASAFKQESDGESLMDEAIATALLTGIVSATNRFSNERTNSLTMAIASKLMQFGADQQLVSTNLDKLKKGTPSNDMLSVKGGHKNGKKPAKEAQPNELMVEHEVPEEETPPDFAAADTVADKTQEANQTQAAQLVEQKLTDSLAQVNQTPAAANVLGDLRQQTDDMLAAAPTAPESAPEANLHGAVSDDNWKPQVAPFAPADQPAESFLPPAADNEEQPVGGDAMAGQTEGLYADNKHGYIAPLGAPAAVPVDAGTAMQDLLSEQPPSVPVPEPVPDTMPVATAPVENPFAPPAPPPMPDVNVENGLPMPPGSPQPMIQPQASFAVPEPMPAAMPEPVMPVAPAESFVPPAPLATEPEVPAMPSNATISPVMPEEVYPSTPANDIGSFQIPGQ